MNAAEQMRKDCIAIAERIGGDIATEIVDAIRALPPQPLSLDEARAVCGHHSPAALWDEGDVEALRIGRAVREGAPKGLAEALREHEEAVREVARWELDTLAADPRPRAADTRAALLAAMASERPAVPAGIDLGAIERATTEATGFPLLTPAEWRPFTDPAWTQFPHSEFRAHARGFVIALLAVRAGVRPQAESDDPSGARRVEREHMAREHRKDAARNEALYDAGSGPRALLVAEEHERAARLILGGSAPPDRAALLRQAVEAVKAARWGAHITDESRPELWIYTVLDGLAGEMRLAPNRKARAAIAALSALLLALPLEAP